MKKNKVMSAAPFELDVSTWQTGFYSIVVTKSTDGKLIYKSNTKIKN